MGVSVLTIEADRRIKELSALRLQSMYRYRKARKKVLIMREIREEELMAAATLKIQTRFRINVAKKKRNEVKTKLDADKKRLAEKRARDLAAAEEEDLRRRGLLLKKNSRLSVVVANCVRRYLSRADRPYMLHVHDATRLKCSTSAAPYVFVTVTTPDTEKQSRYEVTEKSNGVNPTWEKGVVMWHKSSARITFTVCAHADGSTENPTFLGQYSLRIGARFDVWNTDTEFQLEPEHLTIYNGAKRVEWANVPE